MYEIQFIREGITAKANAGESLLEVMRRAGLTPDAPCGGRGRCGKCAVKLCGGKDTVVKACVFSVYGDLIVDTMGAEASAKILTKGAGHAVAFDPAIRQIQIEVPACPAGRSISDWSRFSDSLRRFLFPSDPACVMIPASPEIASKLGPVLKQTKGRAWAIIHEDTMRGMPAGEGTVSDGCEMSGPERPGPAEVQVVSVLDVTAERHPFYMAAFDIGTTTVVGYLLHGEDGSEAAVASRMNPQVQYGADVISRANYSLEHGMEELSGCIQAAVDEMLAEMAGSAGIETDQIYLVSAAGNTCMHHLFLGICVDSLVHAPYNPAAAEPMILRASGYGLHINPRGLLLMLPNIAGFVGADTVACLVSSDLASQEEWTLLIDIGTNGEVVLGRGHRMIACSTAAGPAFEGSRISRGMRGAPGAVNSVKWQDGAWKYTTIGDKKARGICGSGLLDLAAELWRTGQISETGELKNGKQIVLVPADETEDGRELALLSRDIGELQLAKAAIAAGVRLLAEKISVPVSEIRQVWLAGAFGSFLSPESACAIGLIPPELRGRITAIGNAAGEGAKEVLQNRAMWEQAAVLAAETEFLELAGLPEFQDYFVDELEFPEK